jgi:hypothetical protein
MANGASDTSRGLNELSGFEVSGREGFTRAERSMLRTSTEGWRRRGAHGEKDRGERRKVENGLLL